MIFFNVYKILTNLMKPLLAWHLKSRMHKGKEHPNRYIEKMGLPTHIRPEGDVIWIHAVSVGESISALSIVEKYISQGKNVLVTTSTLTSANVMEQRLPAGAIHQFRPIDVEHWVHRFLEYWKPNQVLWMESELWPNILKNLKDRGIKTYLINARISEKTMARLKYIPFIASSVFKCFTAVYAQDEKYVSIIQKITGVRPLFLGNLKYSAPILLPSKKLLLALKDSIGNRPVWVAISTHPEDEVFLTPAIKTLHKNIPNLLTIIVPRHPERMEKINGAIKFLSYAVRSQRQNITENTDIYIADTIGEISLFLSAVDICFIGGSTDGGYGGHNPLEPANLNCAIVQGMDTNHFDGICKSLNNANGQIQVQNYVDLHEAISSLLNDETRRNALIKGAKKVAQENNNIVDIIIQSTDSQV